MLRIFFILILCCYVCSSCREAFQYHPNEIRLEEEEKNLTDENLARLKNQSAGDTLHLLVMGDTQRFYDDAEDFVDVANQFDYIDFVVHLGDISDFGMAQEFKWILDIFSELKWPYLTVVGNHDLLANGRKVYQVVFGQLNYSFTYGHTKFIFLDTNSREYNFNGTIPDLAWLRDELKMPVEEAWEQAVVVSHVPPFDNDFDKSLEQEYHNALLESGKVSLSLHGHQHGWKTEKRYDDFITYHVTTTVDKRGFSYLKIWKGGFSVERISY